MLFFALAVVVKLSLSDGLVGCYLNNYTDDGVLLVLPGGETVRDHGSGALQVGSDKDDLDGYLSDSGNPYILWLRDWGIAEHLTRDLYGTGSTATAC